MLNTYPNLNERPLAFIDLETSGDIFGVHEILEIGLVVFNQKNLDIEDILNVKIKPNHIENAVPKALERNGYNSADWIDAITLTEAMKQFSEKTVGAIFCAYNATFDWGFMNDAFRKTEVGDTMDYHRLDILSLAWVKGLKNSKSWSLKTACEMFGVPSEPIIHRAINGAMTAFELYKKLTLL